ncbi:MAG: glutathione peroxidase [Candidatus Methanomethylophilus sp.]|nr:glutathione peroxidase [Methanomethylophilus sp.]MBQ4412183.1 glutathione peroxidase [Methanomethylophilus sp.]MBQ5447611.1 glutathione peroxidase [Methanomethylophilus sp.]
MDIYGFEVKAMNGTMVPLSDYKGKVMLVVNTATGCGFTPQYEDLQKIYDEFKDKGLEILDFPCNQFREQAPGSDEEIHTFCKGRFGITFPQFSKIDVIGENADPLFKYLSENTKFEGFGKGLKVKLLAAAVKSVDKDYKDNSNVKWNFTKFLIGRDGSILARFEPTVGMEEVRAAVAKAVE